jgi:predicted ester cyclase
MSAETNKALVRREFEEMFCQGGDLDTAGEFYAPNYVLHEPTSGEVRGLEVARQFAATYREAFPDLQSAIEDQVAEGDKVVSRFSGRGTHLGETEDFGPATGNSVEITGITIDRFAEGRIVEEWTSYDALGLLQQIGLVPEADEQEA